MITHWNMRSYDNVAGRKRTGTSAALRWAAEKLERNSFNYELNMLSRPRTDVMAPRWIDG